MLKAISGHTSTKGIRRYLTKKNRALATRWAQESFPNHEVAIVYHDDNANDIPHAHVVVNNTDVETGRRLQDPDPKALARSLQKIARGLGMSPLEPPAPSGVAARAARRGARRAPATHRDEHVRRAERELAERGEYSWVADIRARVKAARSVSRSEAEFRSLLASLGVEVSDNSPRAARRDWVYSLADAPTRKVSGERLGLSYGRERLQLLLRAGGARRIADAGERAIAAIARRAVAVGDLEELKTLSEAVALIESSRASCAADLDGLAAKGAPPRLVDYARQSGILPEERPIPKPTPPACPGRTMITSMYFSPIAQTERRRSRQRAFTRSANALSPFSANRRPSSRAAGPSAGRTCR